MDIQEFVRESLLQIDCAPIGGLVLYMLREQSATRWVGPDTDKKEMTDEQRKLLRESAISLFRLAPRTCEDYCASAVSYLEATGKYLRGGDYDNLLVVLRQLELKILPKLTKSDFASTRIEERFRGLMGALEANNDRNVFRQWIDAFHRGVPAAMSRTTSSNGTATA